MSVKFRKGNSVQGQEVGQTNRCECKHVLLLLFQPSFLLCLSPHRSSPSPPSPLILDFAADDATASSSDGSNTRILPEPHGSHCCCANATNGSIQCQRAGGHSYDTVLRYTMGSTQRNTLTAPADTHTHTQRCEEDSFPISQCWLGPFSSLAELWKLRVP